MKTGTINIQGAIYSTKLRPKGWTYDAQVILHVYNIPGNCKQAFINSINGLMMLPSEERKTFFNEVLKHCHITVHLNTTVPELAKWIVENYETYFYVEVPVGYGSGFHHHILIKNKLSGSGNTVYLREDIGEVVKHTIPKNTDKPALKDQFLSLFKLKRRKTDIVDDLIKLI